MSDAQRPGEANRGEHLGHLLQAFQSDILDRFNLGRHFTAVERETILASFRVIEAELRSEAPTPVRARLDADGKAKPLTEIVAVMPPDDGSGRMRTIHSGQATHYVVRPTAEARPVDSERLVSENYTVPRDGSVLLTAEEYSILLERAGMVPKSVGQEPRPADAQAVDDGTFGFAVTFEDRRDAADLLVRVAFYCDGLVIPERDRFLAEAAWMFGAVRSRRERDQTSGSDGGSSCPIPSEVSAEPGGDVRLSHPLADRKPGASAASTPNASPAECRCARWNDVVAAAVTLVDSGNGGEWMTKAVRAMQHEAYGLIPPPAADTPSVSSAPSEDRTAGAAQERAAVVAWLRKHRGGQEIAGYLLKTFADCIERGEHNGERAADSSSDPDLVTFALWIADRVRLGEYCDHACERCIPGGTMVQEGFVCVPHQAHDIKAATEFTSDGGRK